MKFYSNLLCGAVFAAVILPAMANVATTAGSNLTAYNGTGAMNNNQWNSLMNGRAGMAQNTAEANFGNCNAIVLRCASPKCASGGCTDMNVAAAIVAGCVNSNQNCKQYGDDLIQYITAQVVAQSTAKVQQQQNAVAIAQAEAQAQAAASAAAAEQNNAQMQQMAAQMAQMQQQMAESMTAMQEQMAATAESQNAQIQNALESRAAESPTYAGAPTAPIETGAVIAGLEGLGVAEQLAAKNGISTDILVREQMGGQIETAIEDATLKMKELKQTLDNIIEYAGCDPSVTECTGPKRVKKFKDMANEFFNPYEEVLDNMYDALILAMTLGIDVSDTIMLLSGACNIWGKYLCDTCSANESYTKTSNEGIEGACVCNTEESGKRSNCYYRVRTDPKTGRVAKDQPHCRPVGTIGDQEKVWHEWIDANSGITGSTQVACISDMIDDISLFRNRRKKTSVDIDTLRDLIAQDSYACRTPTNNDEFDVLKHCGANRCNVSENDSARYSQLIKAVNTRTLPAIQTTGSPENRLCFNDEKDFDKFDNGGSSNSEIVDATICSQYFKYNDCEDNSGCQWVFSSGTCEPRLLNREPTEAELDADPSGKLCRKWYSKDWCDEYYKNVTGGANTKTGVETWQNKYLQPTATKKEFKAEGEINCFGLSQFSCNNSLGKCKYENGTCVPNTTLTFGL